MAPDPKLSANDLRRDEARERARLLQVSTYDVELDLTGDERTFRSTTRVAFGCAHPGADTFIELTAPRLLQVRLNGADLDPDKVFDGNRVRLESLAADNDLTVVADCAYSRTGEGLHRFVDRVDKAAYLYTQFETYDAHRVYACFDQPDLKATFTVTVIAPDEWLCVSNGRVTSCLPAQTPVGDSRLGARRWRFAITPVLSTYITALVAGPYHEVRGSCNGPSGPIELGLYCRRSLAEHLDAEELFHVTRQGFEFFHRVFDYPYPFDKYDQLFVPEFNAGAMENAGCVTFLEDYVFRSKVTDARYERRAETILHEMAHMWFGDLVTMRWWDDLWLNESFATYISVLCQATSTRWTNAWTTFCNAEKTWAYRQDQLPSTHPIAADAPDIETVKSNFDGITYAKGAAVLKQLVAWVGQEEFLAGMRTYFRRHEYGNTTLRDLLDVLEQASGRDLAAWSQEWLETAGVNTVRCEFTVDADGAYSSFRVSQSAPADHPTLRSHRMAIGLYDVADGALVRRERHELDVLGATTEVVKLVGTRAADLVLPNDDDLAYTKIRLDPDSLRTAIEHAAGFAASLPRALVWTAAWDMCRDAELPARDYLRLVLATLGVENDIGVVQSLLRLAKAAIVTFGDPANRAAGLRSIAETCWELATAAEPGSDFQLAFVIGYASAASDEDHVRTLRELLDGDRTLDRLAVDADLRWNLLTRLAVLGVVGEEEIERELDRDNTSTGERHAATARAALPQPETKRAAWHAVVETDELSNHLQVAAMAGFAPSEQIELVRPYAERYFDAVAGLFRTRTMEMALTIAEMLYPAYLVEPDLVERTEAYLDSEQPQPALRRVLVEGRDGVARALRARACDRAAAAHPGG